MSELLSCIPSLQLCSKMERRKEFINQALWEVNLGSDGVKTAGFMKSVDQGWIFMFKEKKCESVVMCWGSRILLKGTRRGKDLEAPLGAWIEGPMTAGVIHRLLCLQFGKPYCFAFCTGQSLGKQLESRGTFIWWGINMQSSLSRWRCVKGSSLCK